MDLLRRVRWGNVARAAAVVAAVALIVMWPRLRPAAPEVPASSPTVAEAPPGADAWVEERPDVAPPPGRLEARVARRRAEGPRRAEAARRAESARGRTRRRRGGRSDRAGLDHRRRGGTSRGSEGVGSGGEGAPSGAPPPPVPPPAQPAPSSSGPAPEFGFE